MAYRSQALDVLPEIAQLANEVLTADEREEIDLISKRLLATKNERQWAISKSILKVGHNPSRPLMYWQTEMLGLPRNTRDCIRYLGDYVDMLVKELAFEATGKGRKSSLSSNARLLLKIPDELELATLLVKYADYLYTPGKHDFQDMPFGRVHRFSAKEVVITCYITAYLAKRILEISPAARNAVEKDNLYTMGDDRWGSADRVEYIGDPVGRG